MPGAKISVEIEKFPREGLRELVPEADVVFYSKTWAVVCNQHPPETLKVSRIATCSLTRWLQLPRETDITTPWLFSKSKQSSLQRRTIVLFMFALPSVWTDHDIPAIFSAVPGDLKAPRCWRLQRGPIFTTPHGYLRTLRLLSKQRSPLS